MVLLTTLVATAAEPFRCVAAWSGAVAGCNVRESFDITAGGASEKAAQKATRGALEAALAAYASAWKVASPLVDPAETAECAAKAAATSVDCYPDATLADEKFCYVTLDDANCWSGDVLKVEITGHKSWDQGRKDMCAAVDKHLVAQNYTDVELRRSQCAASCAARTKVNCP